MSGYRAMYRPYVKGIFSGMAAVIALWEVLPQSVPLDLQLGGELSWFASRIIVFFFMTPLFMLFTPFVLIVGNVFKWMKLRRGIADVMVGAIAGALAPVVFVVAQVVYWTNAAGSDLGQYADMSSLERLGWGAVPFALGGAFGGLMFWRAMGYPGLDRRSAEGIDAAQDVMSDGLGADDALDLGLAAHGAMKRRPSRG